MAGDAWRVKSVILIVDTTFTHRLLRVLPEIREVLYLPPAVKFQRKVDMSANSGYREIEHTADWQLEVWAPDLPTLFSLAAEGMLALANVRIESSQQVNRKLHLKAGDLESLLVSFLSELLYLGEAQGLGFGRTDIVILPGQPVELRANLLGGQILEQAKEIKAVTYHNLEIRQVDGLYRVRIVFDV